jgi:hypothetical protein
VPTLSVLDSVSPESRFSPGAAGVSADIVDEPHTNAAARAKFSRPGPFPVAALQWRSANDLPGAAPLTFTLTEHIGWLAPGAGDADPADVVKQVSFLQASRGVTVDEFRSHYRDHVDVARRHMPTLWQYVQYDVTGVEGPDPATVRAAQGIVAVSVLWFRSTADFLERYFASPEDEAEFRSHEGFLDLSKAFTFVAGVHLSREPTARP